MNLAIIGGGAAGFFAAICAKENHPNATITIYERSNNLLQKVRVSGGGKCNLSNACSKTQLLSAYPRGANFLKTVFQQFDNHDSIRWFNKHGVATYIRADNHVFPSSNHASTIINLFLELCKKYNIRIKTKHCLNALIPQNESNNGFILCFKNHHQAPMRVMADKVILASGGKNNLKGYDYLSSLHINIIPPVPSLFTFNCPKNPIHQLMGTSSDVILSVYKGESMTKRHKLAEDAGPLLVTHWGFSGPVVLKLSAQLARLLAAEKYQFTIAINWMAYHAEKTRLALQQTIHNNPKKSINNLKFAINDTTLTQKLWRYLIHKANIDGTKNCAELSHKNLHALSQVLTQDNYQIKGKSTFKEEFVTAGGVNLNAINPKTMASKHHPNLYYAGEVVDIDAITGGYNFTAAWATAFIAAKLNE